MEAEKQTYDQIDATSSTIEKHGGQECEEFSSIPVQEQTEEHEGLKLSTNHQDQSDSSKDLNDSFKPHEQTSESFTIDQDHQNNYDYSQTEDCQHTWSDDIAIKNTLIGKKRRRIAEEDDSNDESEQTFCKRAKIDYGEQQLKSSGKRQTGQKFNQALKQGTLIAKWLGAVCLPQTNFSKSYK